MEQEIWRGVVGFSNYEVSNLGRIKSLSRTFIRSSRNKNNPPHYVTTKEKIISGWHHAAHGQRKNRCKVALRKDDITYETPIHVIVLTAFRGCCPPGMEGCHNDGNYANNRLSNLRWDTHKSNQMDMRKHGTFKPPPVHYGEKHPFATISDKEVAKIRAMKFCRGDQARLAREYGVADITISRIRKGLCRSKSPRAGCA